MAELVVNKKSISKLFKDDMQDRKFIIPDYQRPYAWDKEKCETLWNDVVENARNPKDDYFLGTIVVYKLEGNYVIIDGQQRITSFFLLLRAFYAKLEAMEDDPNVKGLKMQIEPCIWDTDPISLAIADKSKIHIESQVITEEDNKIFHAILENGIVMATVADNYSVNYQFFKEKCDGFAADNPMKWRELCIFILNKCVVLPIECDVEDTALTIFSTLNDRGMPLSDSDIFKARIYRNFNTPQEKKEFTEKWKELTRQCKEANLSIDDIFRYYMHVIRARNNDKSREIGLRNFYKKGEYVNLQDAQLFKDIELLAAFWVYVNTREDADADDGYVISLEAQKWLHCLSYYPNEFWKYPVSVFFLKNRQSQSFDNDFCGILQKLVALLFAKFLFFPTVNRIRDDIFSACNSIDANNTFTPDFSFLKDKEEVKETEFSQKLRNNVAPRLARALLLLDAYLDPKQQDLIPTNFQIEHIFPQKWQNTCYNGWDEDTAKTYRELFGNKIVFERKLNIQAGNGYFSRKKKRYAESEIACVLRLSQLPQDDWSKAAIEKREQEIASRLLTFFKRFFV